MNLGLFQKRIDGDDFLMELARLRFEQVRLGIEIHAGTPDELEPILLFKPWPEARVIVHLPREFDLCQSRLEILELARHTAVRTYGLVLHDHPSLPARLREYVAAAEALDASLRTIDRAPLIFIEYAAGLDLQAFAEFATSIRDLPRISVCIDTGHVGIWQTRQTYARAHPGEDVCALKSRPPHLCERMPDVDAAVQSALPAVLRLVEVLGGLGKPLHFHLHDGHPLSTVSPFGVADHLSFLASVPLPFEYRGRPSAPLMFGPGGLLAIRDLALKLLGHDQVSFTLEIHPTGERLPLADVALLFAHWRDLTNAEKMNHWLDLLAQNHALLRQPSIPATQ